MLEFNFVHRDAMADFALRGALLVFPLGGAMSDFLPRDPAVVSLISRCHV
jgi:hypothetical protein